MSPAAARAQGAQAWRLMQSGLDRLSVYLPIMLMGLLALGTYWLARNTPTLGAAEAQRQATHEPDSVMRRFSVKTFDATGRIKSEVHGDEARHFPDTDTTQIDRPRIRTFNERGELTVATARSALSNADGSELQLIGDAVVTREGAKDAQGRQGPQLEFRGEFLHVFTNTERIRSHKPVELVRGADRFTADSLEFDNIERVMDLRGRVRGVIGPRNG